MNRTIGWTAILLAAAPTAASPAEPGAPRVAAMLATLREPFKQQHHAVVDDRFDQLLGDTARAGFRVVQGWLPWFATAEEADALSAVLTRHGLTMRAACTDGHLYDSAAAAEIALIVERATIARRYGLSMVIVSMEVRPDGAEKTADELEIQARNLNHLGEKLRRLGISLAVHAHDQEMRSHAREWYHILRNTRPADVALCMDLHWVWRGGEDPLRLLADAGLRVSDLHLRNSRGGIWLEDLDTGDVDYSAVAKVLERIRYKGTYTVELAYEKKTARTRTLGENLVRSRGFVRSVLGQ